MCIRPILKDKKTQLFVPCGRCYQCVRKRKLEWEVRLDAAQRWSDCSFFRLLSYDDEHYNFDPRDKSIGIGHLQKFAKLLRIRIQRAWNPNAQLKYFIASEFGDKGDRLHYHACLFVKGVKLSWTQMHQLINDIWPYGYIGNTFPLTSKNISYTCKYIQKQNNFKVYSRFSHRDLDVNIERDLRTKFSAYTLDLEPKYVYRGKCVDYPKYWLSSVYSKGEMIRLGALRRDRWQETLAEETDEKTINRSKEEMFKQSLQENRDGKYYRSYEPEYINNKDIQPNEHF